jgi:cysteine sulfinate desulfinase/cysteine desulfurase-like protein
MTSVATDSRRRFITRLGAASIGSFAHAAVEPNNSAVGAIPVNVKALGCHAYATSGHKWLMAPKGTGLLYVSSEASAAIQPIQWQDGRRYGAESAGVGPQPLVIGLGAAISASS